MRRASPGPSVCRSSPSCFLCVAGKGGEAAVLGVGSEQQQGGRVHPRQGGAAVRRAGGEEGQVLHQTGGPQGETRPAGVGNPPEKTVNL